MQRIKFPLHGDQAKHLMSRQMSAVIDRIDFFSEFSPTIRQAIAPKFRLRQFAAEERIIEDAEQGSDVFFVLTGSVCISQFTQDGHEVIYDIRRSGNMFGEFSALDEKPRSADARAFELTELACISASDFRLILSEHPEISLKIQKHLISIVRKLNQRLMRHLTGSSQARVFNYILEQVDLVRQEKAAVIHMPKQAVLAAMLDISRETVTRALSQLLKEGIIGKEGSGIRLLDEPKLKQMLEKETN